jgi:hypothetical protein
LIFAPNEYSDASYSSYETRIEAVDVINSGGHHVLTLGHTNSEQLTLGSPDKVGRLFVTEHQLDFPGAAFDAGSIFTFRTVMTGTNSSTDVI